MTDTDSNNELRQRKTTTISPKDDQSSSPHASPTTADEKLVEDAFRLASTAAQSSHTNSIGSYIPPPPLPEQYPPYSTSPLRFIPFILLFLFIFLSISYVSTGTLNYGLGPVLGEKIIMAKMIRPMMKQMNRAKIYVQRALGLRKPKKKKKKEDEAGKPRGPPKPPPLLDIHPPAERDPNELYLTLEELAEHTGKDGTPIFLAVHGRIFDVTPGRDFYGPGAGYSNLAGKDCSRAFATSCYNNDNLHDTRGLSYDQRKGIDGWYTFYADHPKYRPVGWVILPEIAPDTPLPNDKC